MKLTKQEAIELLSERYMVMSMCTDKEYCVKHNAAIDMAISSLKAELGRDINVGRNERLKGDRAMRDNEIIEALDFCEGYNGVSFCSRCPLFNKDNCSQILSHEAYNLIRRQKAEIEQLKAKHEILIKNADTAFQDGLNEAQDLYASQIRNEIIKEFAERFKEKISQGVCCGRLSFVETKNELDNLVKEMTEVKNEKNNFQRQTS